MHSIVIIGLLLIEITFLLVFIFIFVSGIVSALYGAPYVPIERRLINDLLVFGGLKPIDVVADLGSGDGRVLIVAMKDFKAKETHGYEGSPWPYIKSLWMIRKSGLANVKVHYGNFFDKDFSHTTFVYAYLFPSLMPRVAKKLAKELRPGARLLCPAFNIELDRYPEFRLIKSEKIGRLTAYLYEKV